MTKIDWLTIIVVIINFLDVNVENASLVDWDSILRNV